VSGGQEREENIMKRKFKKVFVLCYPGLGSLRSSSLGLTASAYLSLQIESNLERFLAEVLVGLDIAAHGDLALHTEIVEE